MKRFSLVGVFVVSLFLGGLFLNGCKEKESTSSVLFSEQSGSSEEDARRDRDVFVLSMETLNTMEDSIDFEGFPGHERMIQTLNRLNKWIRRRDPDPKWKPEPAFVELHRRAVEVTAKVETVSSLLQSLQGAGPVLEDRQKLTATLEELGRELTSLSKTSGIPFFAQYAEELNALRNKFRTLDAMQNVQEGAIRAFVRQLTGEQQRLGLVAQTLRTFSESLAIEAIVFHLYDVDYLKQAVWMRSVSAWARGDKQGALDRAKALYDWTVRHVDLRSEIVPVSADHVERRPLQLPWQTLLLGSGTYWDRAWVFIELLRQQRIDACLLGARVSNAAEVSVGETVSGQIRYWGIGVLLEGEIHVFLLHEGVPLPGKQGPVFDESGVLSFPEVATMKDLLDDPSILSLALTGDEKSALGKELLASTLASLVVTADSCSMRMRIFEKELLGEQTMVLYTPSQEQRERFLKVPGVREVDLWQYPVSARFESLAAPQRVREEMFPLQIPSARSGDFSLWMGRIYYLKGKRNGPESATTRYQDAMTPERLVQERKAAWGNQASVIEAGYTLVNIWAGYWLGVAALQDGKWESAREYFMEKSAFRGQTPWENGILYNLGRIDEAEKKYESAVRFYQRSGNGLRAKWIQQLTGNEEKKKPEEGP